MADVNADFLKKVNAGLAGKIVKFRRRAANGRDWESLGNIEEMELVEIKQPKEFSAIFFVGKSLLITYDGLLGFTITRQLDEHTLAHGDFLAEVTINGIDIFEAIRFIGNG